MKLIATWGAESERLDRLLARGCLNCASALGRLVRHEVTSGTQIWLSCCSCGSRIEGPLPHRKHPQFPIYPLWREGGCDYPLPEELGQTARPLTFVEVVRAVFENTDPILANAHAVAWREMLVAACGFTSLLDMRPAFPAIIAACGPKAYVATTFGGGARLLSIEPGLVKMLTPRLVGQKVQGRAIVAASDR